MFFSDWVLLLWAAFRRAWRRGPDDLGFAWFTDIGLRLSHPPRSSLPVTHTKKRVTSRAFRYATATASDTRGNRHHRHAAASNRTTVAPSPHRFPFCLDRRAPRYLDEDDGRWVVRVRTAADSFKLDVPFFSHRASPWAVDLGEVHGKINNGR